jgi:hypothetical protein
MMTALIIVGQLVMLLTSIWMLKTWAPKDDKPGWFSAVFCSGLLIGSFAAYSLIAQIVQLSPMFWFEQLALYAAYPLLSFVLLALVFKIDWPKEAWGRILLGVCGIYWICQQTQSLNYLLAASALISTLAMAKLIMAKSAAICQKQANLALSGAALASVIIILNTLNSTPVIAELAAKWPLELGLGVLLVAINRAFNLKLKAN